MIRHKRTNRAHGHGCSRILAAAAALLCLGAFTPRARAAEPPIRIGVIGEASSVAGGSITRAAQLAADEINAHGGIGGRMIKLFVYDDHSSAADAVRAYQRAVTQDHVNAVIASYISEIALAIEPWAARLHVPTITPGAASTLIDKKVHDDYAHYKYMFHGWINSKLLADTICQAAKTTLVDHYRMTSAVVMSEDAAWTSPLDNEYLKCLPKIGLKVVGHIRFNPDTTDFTPIFNQIEAKHPSVIVTGISHVGVQPTVQWHDQQVPIPMFGQSSQATTSAFWKDTHGAAEGVITATAAPPGIALTPKTIPFINAYVKRFGVSPAYDGFSTYDDVYIIANAVARAGSTNPDKMVAAMQKTNYVGVLGRVEFYGRKDAFTNGIKVGPGFIQGTFIQWQNGKQVCIWPASICHGKVTFPAFIKLSAK